MNRTVFIVEKTLKRLVYKIIISTLCKSLSNSETYAIVFIDFRLEGWL